MYSTTNIYSDLDVDKLEILPPSQPHHAVDLAVIEADTQGKSPPAPHSLTLNVRFLYDRIRQDLFSSP